MVREVVRDSTATFARAGIDIDALAARLQEEGTKAIVNSWQELLAVCESKTSAIDRRSAATER